MGPAIELRELTVDRGKTRVLDRLSLDIPGRLITGLLGPSGCGKTTLMRSIVGVQVVRAGTVTVLGLPAGSPALRRRVGYVTQSPAVYPDLTVEENLSYFASLLGAGRQAVKATIASVGLEPKARSLVRELSGGERARVSLATALLNQPEVLVLDEPTVGLDPVLRDELWSMFRRLVNEGRTLLVSSHVMDEASRCDELILMREGQVLAHESPAALLARTGAADVGDAFLRVIPSRPGAR